MFLSQLLLGNSGISQFLFLNSIFFACLSDHWSYNFAHMQYTILLFVGDFLDSCHDTNDFPLRQVMYDSCFR